MSSTQRKLIEGVLSTQGKYDKKEVKNIEIAIHGMCRSLHKETGEETVDLYAKFAYEKIGEFITHPELKNGLLENIANLIISWDSVVYVEWKLKEDNIISQKAEGMKIVKGEFKCRNIRCKSDECFYYQSQQASCDEAATTHVVCTKCSHRYKFS